MGYRPEEFNVAFNNAAETYPFARRSVAEQVLGHFELLKRTNDRSKQADKKPFWFLIRSALNEANVMGELERKPYKAIIGYLYGKHGNFTAQKYRDNQNLKPAQPRFPLVEACVETVTKPNGQVAWKF